MEPNALKLKPGNIGPAMVHIKETWKRRFPDNPLEYVFIDTVFSRLYRTEEQAGRLVTIFAGLSLFIACLVLATVSVGGATAQDETAKERLIHTSATGQVTTTPDQAEISVSVQTENIDPKAAQAANAATMADVVNALKGAGVDLRSFHCRP
jgi:hypothetical protein